MTYGIRVEVYVYVYVYGVLINVYVYEVFGQYHNFQKDMLLEDSSHNNKNKLIIIINVIFLVLVKGSKRLLNDILSETHFMKYT